MKILLVNDDGIYADGIVTLANVLKEKFEVYIAAPESERSAYSNAITLKKPITYETVEIDGIEKAYKISGTPADCTKFALSHLLDFKPDLVISGINKGPNMGVDVRYSGTVAAAFEGVVCDIPSFSVSLDTFEKDADFLHAATFVKDFILSRFKNNIELFTKRLININIPYIHTNEFKGTKITSLNNFYYTTNYKEKIENGYVVDGKINLKDNRIETDYIAVKSGYVSITPLILDLTNYNDLNSVKVLEL